jgi:alpha-ribazole phosphatase
VTAAQRTRLLLVRHAETTWNVERRFQGQQDSPLTERGWHQAERLAARLAHQPLDAIYASDLGRTLATAERLAGQHNLPVQSCPALREAAFGAYEGATFAELEARYGEEVRRWAADPVRLAPPGGETLLAFQARVAAGLTEIVARHQGETLLLVAHGGSVRAGVIDALAIDLDRFRSLRMDNASLTIIDWYDGFKSLVVFNDTAHLLDEA